MWFHNLITKIIAIFSSIIMFISGGAVTINPGVQKNTVTVNFVNYDAKTSISKIDTQINGFATPPTNPTKSGSTFIGWSGNYYNVQKNETVKAVFSDEKNIFIVSRPVGNVGDTVTVLLSISGKVKTCGFDLKLTYDSSLKLVSFDDDLDLDIVTNSSINSNTVMLNFSSASDKTKNRDIIELRFKINETNKTALPVCLTVNSIKELSGNKVINSDYIIVDGYVKIK